MPDSPVQSAIHLSTNGHLAGAERETPLSAPAQEAPPEVLPRGFGKYTLEHVLGHGAMGTVYLAHDPQLDRRVALKIPRPLVEDGHTWRERFLAEARAAATLHHPQICPVFEVGEIDSQPYLTMAFIEGETLAARLRRTGTLQPTEAAELVATVCRAMAEAHERGIVHRDLKPANIMLDRRGQPVIMDFGLAMRFENSDDPRLTRSGMALGTPCYMSPEQASGDHRVIGPSADVYALGVILFELVTGQLPFQEKTFGKLIAQIERDPPPQPQSINPAVDERLGVLILRALAKTPEQRFASATELADALKAHQSGASLAVVTAPALRLQETSEWKSDPERAAAKATLQRSHAGSWSKVVLRTLAVMLALLAGVVLYIQTNDGDLVVKLNDPKAKVTFKVNGNEVKLTADGKLFDIRVGKNQMLEVSGEDIKTVSKSFEIIRGKETVVAVTLVPKPPPTSTIPPIPPTKFAASELVQFPGWQIATGMSLETMKKWLAERKAANESVMWLDGAFVGQEPVFAAVAALDDRRSEWKAFVDLTRTELSDYVTLEKNRDIDTSRYEPTSLGGFIGNKELTGFGLYHVGRSDGMGGVIHIDSAREQLAQTKVGWVVRVMRPVAYEGELHFLGLYMAPAIKTKSRHAIERYEDGLIKELERERAEGSHLVSVTPFEIGGIRRFATVYREDKAPATWELHRDQTAAELKGKALELTKNGLVPVSISVCELNGEPRFTTVWDRDHK